MQQIALILKIFINQRFGYPGFFCDFSGGDRIEFFLLQKRYQKPALFLCVRGEDSWTPAYWQDLQVIVAWLIFPKFYGMGHMAWRMALKI